MARLGGWNIGRFVRRVFLVLFVLALLPIVLTITYSAVPPVSTLMLGRWVTFQNVDRRFVPLERVAPVLIASVVASEDARFCRHNGVDWGALREVLDDADEDGPARGASTITMQTAKNLFLWNGRSYVRKALELPLALMVDLLLGKKRVLTIYLNVAEWGEGIFGIEAAAQRYFGKGAASLDAREAALLAAALPNPILRDPTHPTRAQRRKAATVAARARGMREWLDCLQ